MTRGGRWERRGLVVIGAGFLCFIGGPVLVIALETAISPIVPAIVGFMLMAAGGMMIAMAAETPRAARSRAGGGAVKITCPNCGAAPSSAAEDGVVTCDYCRTRFLP